MFKDTIKIRNEIQKILILESSDIDKDHIKYVEEIAEEYGYELTFNDFNLASSVVFDWADIVAYRDIQKHSCSFLFHKNTDYYSNFFLNFNYDKIETFVLNYIFDPIENRFDILDL